MPHQEWRDKDGLILPSVTEVVGVPEVAGITPKELSEWRGRLGNREADRLLHEAGDLGTNVHALIEESMSRGELAENENPKESALAARVWEWIGKTVMEPVATEVGLLNSVDGYGGTFDVVARFAGASPATLWVVDWKTAGAIHDTYALQLAAYARSYNLSKGLSWADGINRGIIVRPRKEAPDKPVETRKFMFLERDFQVFAGLLKLWQFLNGRGEWSAK